MSVYPDVHITEYGVRFGDMLLPDLWIEHSPKITGQDGYHHRVTLTVFVKDIHIGAGADFDTEVIP